MNKLLIERAIEVLYTVRGYYANLTAGYPKGKDCKGIDDVTCSEIANSCLMAIKTLEQSKWIPCNERLPMLNEEAYSNNVLIQFKNTKFTNSVIYNIEIACYDKSAISSDGIYMDTEGWVLENGNTLSMDEVIAWMPLPEPYKADKEN